MLGNNASYVIEYPVLEILSPGDFFFIVIIHVVAVISMEKKIPRTWHCMELDVDVFCFYSVSIFHFL